MIRSSEKLDMQATAIATKRARIPALDFTKGILVLFMVLYHWINYFVGSEWPYYRYLRFLSPAFIFISGFMISNVYLSKYGSADPRLPRRLLTRGLKLIAIFIALNVARDSVLPMMSSRVSLSDQIILKGALAAFVTGNLTDKVVSFSILVPIAYLLILSAILVRYIQRFRWIFQGVGILIFSSALGMNLAGAQSMNLEILAIGVFGIILGFASQAEVYRIIRHPYLLVLAYVLYLAAITIWNVSFLLELTGVFLTVSLIYLVGSVEGDPGKIRDIVILLGRYSLFGYIWQIVVLQVLGASLRRVNFNSSVAVLSLCAAFAFTVLGVGAVERARVGSRRFDRLYKVVFN